MAVAFKELAGSPVETYTPEGMKAQRRILVAWEDRHAMVAELLGDEFEFGGQPQAQYPSRGGVVAMDVRLEPWPECPDQQGAFNDISTDLNSYSGKYTQIVVDYELLDTTGSRPDLPDVEANTFLTYRMDFGGEYIELPGHSLSWEDEDDAPVPPEALPTIRVPIVEHHVTWHRVVNPPWSAIRDCIGTVNATEFMGAGAETVLFDGATADKQFVRIDQLETPQFGWKITYVLREKAVKYNGATGPMVAGWNHAYRSLPVDDPNWDRLIDKNSQGLYRTSDFSTLFQFTAVA